MSIYWGPYEIETIREGPMVAIPAVVIIIIGIIIFISEYPIPTLIIGGSLLTILALIIFPPRRLEDFEKRALWHSKFRKTTSKNKIKMINHLHGKLANERIYALREAAKETYTLGQISDDDESTESEYRKRINALRSSLNFSNKLNEDSINPQEIISVDDLIHLIDYYRGTAKEKRLMEILVGL